MKDPQELIFLEPSFKQKVRRHLFDRLGKGCLIQGPAINQNPQRVPDPSRILPIRLIIFPGQSKSGSDLFKLGRGEIVAKMIQQPDRCHILGMHPGPTH